MFFRDKDWYGSVNLFGNLFPMFFVTDGCQISQILKYLPGTHSAFGWDYLGKRVTMAGVFVVIVLVILVVAEMVGEID